MSAKHARPAGLVLGRTAGRRLATAAIILAAGATPLLAAAGAQADTAADPLGGAAADGSAALPVLGSLPLGLGTLTGPLGQDLPLGSAATSGTGLPLVDGTLPLVESVPSLAEALPLGSLGGLPVDGLPAGAAAGQLLTRAAPLPDAAAPLAALDSLGALSSLDTADPAGLSSLTQSSLTAVTDSTSGALGSIGSTVPGGLGGLAAGFTPQTDALAGTVLQQAAPVVAQLQQSGVPTVGDLTNRLGQTTLPVVGPVGHLTQTLPLSTVLGTSNPLADTLGTATQL